MYRGNYPSFAAARRAAGGYENPNILTRIAEAAAQVRDGQAVFERDGVTFDHPEYRFPLLTGLLRAALLENQELRLADFGGALGSSYFQCRPFLNGLKSLRWCVVEQPHVAARGREEFRNGQLDFYDTIGDCVRSERPNLLLLSGTLQYLPDPYAVLDELLQYRIPHLIVDRTPILHNFPDRITIQRVPSQIYGIEVSYPAWFLNGLKLLGAISRSYDIITEFEALAGVISLEDTRAVDMGLNCQLRNL